MAPHRNPARVNSYHELVYDKLRTSFEQVDQRSLPLRGIEEIASVVEGNHRQTSTASGDPVKETGRLLFSN
jgi:hypothetical protein